MLLLAQVSHSLTNLWTFNDILCQVMGAVQHMFWLTVFGWTAVLAWDMKRTFLELAPEHSFNMVRRYCALVWGISLGLVCPSLVVSLLKYPIYSSRETCWLKHKIAFIVTFMTPVCLTSFWNIVNFAQVIMMLKEVMDVTRNVSNRAKKDEVMIYCRVSMLLGFNWIVGISATFVGMDWLWFVFEILNSLQGFGIFLAIVIRKRVFHMLQENVREQTINSVT